MTMPVDIDLNLDPSGYVSGLRSAGAETTGFAGTLRSTAVALQPMQKAMNLVTPSRAMLAAQTAFVGMAGRTQRELSGMQATAAVTNTNVGKLTKSMTDLAKTYPIGNKGAREVVIGLTQMGVAAAGQEKRVGALAATFVKLGGASGEAIAPLARDMVQLSRTMNTGLDTKRMENLADSLVTVSKTTGTSATGITTFSKAIGPLAQAAGIGQTSVFGISSAFSKLGDDGFAAATAFNKVLSDLNASVREGTPQMRTYAQMVGLNVEEFDALFKQNPAEAVTRFFEAIRKAGPRGATMLEQLGMEGVRTSRAITNVATAGDLRGSIATAVGSYGNGMNDKAAQAAYGGLYDSMERFGAVTEQAAEALGRPFLGAVTRITNLAGAGASGAGKVLGSGPVQGALTAVSYAALPLLITKALLGPLLTGLGLAQAATSGPVRSAAGAFGGAAAAARGGNQMSTRLGRWGADQEMRRQTGAPMGRGAFGSVNQWVGNAAAGAGGAWGTYGPQRGIPGRMNLLGQAGMVLSGGAGSYFRMLSESARLARTPTAERQSRMTPYGRNWQTWSANRQYASYAYGPGGVYGEDRDAARQMRRDANAQLRQDSQRLRQGQGFGGWARDAWEGRGFAGGAANVARGAITTPVQALGSAAVLGGRALGSVAGALGPIGMGMLAFSGGSYALGQMKQGREQMGMRSETATSVIDEYRIAMGKASDATQTFTGRMQAAAEAIASGTTSVSEAFKIGADDIKGAAAVDKPIRSFGSAEAAVGALRTQQSTYGMGPDEITRISYDLINEFGRDTAQKVLDEVQKPADGGKPTSRTGVDEMGGTADIERTARALARNPQQGGFSGGVQRLWNAGIPSTRNWYAQTTTEATQQGAAGLAADIENRMGSREGKYGGDYARQQATKEMDTAVAAALEEGNMSAVNDLVQALQTRTQGKDNTFRIGEEELRKYGFTGAMGRQEGDRGKAWEQNYGRFVGGNAQPTLQESYYVNMLGGQGANPLTQLFTATGFGAGTDANTSMRRLVTDKAGDPGFQTQAIAEAVRYFQDAGVSVDKLAVSSADAVNAIANVADAGHQAAMALGQIAQVQMQRQNQYGGTPGTGALRQGEVAYQIASTRPTNSDGLQAQQEAVGQLQQIESQAVEAVRARLQQQREFQVSSVRAEYDYGRQIAWARADHMLQMERAEEDYQIGRSRAQAAFGRQQVRATDDFGRQQLYREQDYNRQRARSFRDFNITMVRQAEDFAKQVYDPYQRIQVQPTWDAANLSGNLGEQNAAIRRQLEDVKKLRGAGVSNPVIEMLGLNDPKNAQQAAVLLADIMNDPRLVATLNQQGTERTSLASQMLGTQVEMKRAREDFAKGMGDMAVDFKTATDRGRTEFGISMSRARQDFKISMGQMGEDQKRSIERANENYRVAAGRSAALYKTSVARMGEDLKRANEVITGEIAEMNTALQKALRGEVVDFQKLTVNGMDSWGEVLAKAADKWKKTLEGTNITMQLDFNTSSANAEANQIGEEKAYRRGTGGALGVMDTGRISSGYGQRNGRLHAGLDIAAPIGTAVRSYMDGEVVFAGTAGGYGKAVYVDHGGGRTTRYAHLSDLRVKDGEQVRRGELIALSGNTGRSTGPHLHFETRVNGSPRDPQTRPFAAGGIATRPTMGLVAEAGSSEGIIPLNQQGSRFMADVMSRFLTSADLDSMQSSRSVTHVNYDSSTHITDHSTRIEGPVTVKANDPNEFFQQAQAKKALDNLTAPPQRRRS